MYRNVILVCALAACVSMLVPAAHAQVEYGATASAEADVAGFPEWEEDENLEGQSALAYAELPGVVADARVYMDEVSCLAEITDVADASALTLDTFFWDTFRVTSRSLSEGTPTTVTFLAELDADLIASSTDPAVDIFDVLSSMTVAVQSVSLTDGAPADEDVLEDLFVGSIALDAIDGLTETGDLVDSGFTVGAVSEGTGYSGSLNELIISGEIDTTVGSEFSLKFSLQTLSSVSWLVTDGTAVADLTDSLELVSFETEDDVRLGRASGLFTPPVPLRVSHVLAVVLLFVAIVILVRRSRKGAQGCCR